MLLEATNKGKNDALVDTATVAPLVALVAVVAVVAVVAFPPSAAVIVPAEKLPEPSRATNVLAVFAVATPVPVGSPLMIGEGKVTVPEKVAAAAVIVPVKVGPAENTALPVPVDVVSAANRFADVGVPRKVATPVANPLT